MKRTGTLYQLIEQLLTFLFAMAFNTLPLATQLMIVGFIKDNLRQYTCIIRQPISYAALLIRKADKKFKVRALSANRRLKQILFNSNRNHKYENSRNNMVSKREACCYEY